MVKTRHGGGEDEDASELADVDHSATNNRPRRSDPQRTKEPLTNGYESDSSDDEKYGRHRRKKRRRQYVSSSSQDGSNSDAATIPASPHEQRSSPVRQQRRSSRRHFNIEGFDPYDCSGSAVRRSTRQRKFTYDTFNQNLMIDGKSVDSADADERTAERAGEEPDTEERKKTRSSRLDVDPQSDVEMDMYTRVKRERRPVKRDMYGIPINEDSKDKTATTTSDTETSDSDDNKESGPKSYNLRVHCPKTNLYKAPPIERQGPPRSQRTHRSEEQPSFRSIRSSTGSSRRRRKRAAFHSSTSSSSGSDDEQRFERRKSRSMVKARNRCLPMNLTGDDVAAGVLRDRSHAGASMADIEPMAIDKSVMFDKIGGLGKHLRALKEMIVFPLLYPEIFTRFKIAPPRGVLFYGPPGTGKTLVARALANECSSSDTKVAFFMRKGADCLSKWVGESERQLRLLFDQAYQMRPSIIFFDEIDGLAPVRSSRQDQIHSSIVSTLLALMDGLDDRGEVVVIGATNRIDSIDPALRRPGRFDREFLFPLPPLEARRQILEIHTRDWNPRLSDPFIVELAQKTVGYCGADLKALCTEAALRALRRRYPQIYDSRDKLQIDVTSVNINAADFYGGMKRIVPTAQRSVSSPARPLSLSVRPLLLQIFSRTIRLFERIFPTAVALVNGASDTAGGAKCPDVDCSDDEIVEEEPVVQNGTCNTSGSIGVLRRRVTPTHRPRLLLSGDRGQGQSSHLGPAILHHFECLPVHVIDLAALYAVGTKTPEEACTQILREAQRTSPSVVYVPHLHDWWNITTDAIHATFTSVLNDVDPATPVLLLATTDVEFRRLPTQARELFSEASDEIVVMHDPDETERKEFFEDLLLHRTCDPPVFKNSVAERLLEPLPKAQKQEARQLTAVELKRLRDQEEQTFRELRLFLRDVINKLGRDRKFAMFAKPVDIEEVPDYYEIITNPMDLSSMMTKIDLHKYQRVQEFLRDIDLICSNALEYNPDRDPQDRAIRHRACALKDTANAIIAAELDTDFEKMCEDIVKARERRGEAAPESIPSYYFTKPLSAATAAAVDDAGSSLNQSDGAQRFSRRVRGIAADKGPIDAKPDNTETEPGAASKPTAPAMPSYRAVTKRIRRTNLAKSSSLKSPWCRGRRRYRKVVVYIDENGKELSALEVHKRNKGVNNAAPAVAANKTLVTEGAAAAADEAGRNNGATTASTQHVETRGGSHQRKSLQGESPQQMNVEHEPPKDVSFTSASTSKAEIASTSRLSAGSCASSSPKKGTGCGAAAARSVIVNRAQCAELLVSAVQRTKGLNIDSLLRLHHQLSLCVYQHRHDFDKSALLKDLELCLQRHTDAQRSSGSNHRPVSL